MTIRIQDIILDVVDTVVAQLPPDCAIVVKDDVGLSLEMKVTFQPASRNASRIIVSSGPHALSVFVEVGEATTVELHDQDETLLWRALLDVLMAVTKTGLVERTWRHRGTIIRSEAEIPLASERPARVSSQFGRRRFLAVSDVVEQRFLPYG